MYIRQGTKAGNHSGPVIKSIPGNPGLQKKVLPKHDMPSENPVVRGFHKHIGSDSVVVKRTCASRFPSVVLLSEHFLPLRWACLQLRYNQIWPSTMPKLYFSYCLGGPEASQNRSRKEVVNEAIRAYSGIYVCMHVWKYVGIPADLSLLHFWVVSVCVDLLRSQRKGPDSTAKNGAAILKPEALPRVRWVAKSGASFMNVLGLVPSGFTVYIYI